MTAAGKSEEVRRLLLELDLILDEHHEANWIRGVKAAIGELTCDDGTLNEGGFDSARSIYKTMNQGGRAFAEYFVWLDDEDDRIAANKNLDNLRARLWNAFNL
ncbi:MAG: hypothetical protein QG638_603 [Pseudomonadota bacterium]|nr:hypothetical protein [Pseudomonadota bacterium]MDQ5902552.1 hypothetical protein [Pseudomonadota bacterium]MDQ5906757.1 hypothetical protein [Pseudomonadota bacterium]MDQ5917423.1 hypothetical protein [Pseudomonadota bacterium]